MATSTSWLPWTVLQGGRENFLFFLNLAMNLWRSQKDNDSVSLLCTSQTERTTEGWASQKSYPEGREQVRRGVCVLCLPVWGCMCLGNANTTKRHNGEQFIPCRWQESNLVRVSTKFLLRTTGCEFHSLSQSWVPSHTNALPLEHEVGWLITAASLLTHQAHSHGFSRKRADFTN